MERYLILMGSLKALLKAEPYPSGAGAFDPRVSDYELPAPCPSCEGWIYPGFRHTCGSVWRVPA
jgi:hypothetical protein